MPVSARHSVGRLRQPVGAAVLPEGLMPRANGSRTVSGTRVPNTAPWHLPDVSESELSRPLMRSEGQGMAGQYKGYFSVLSTG